MAQAGTLFFALLAFALCLPLPAQAASLDELIPFLSIDRYSWREFSDGRRLLKETGELVSGGVVLGGRASLLTFRGKAELFGGEVDYDGETQAPDPVPVRTEVNYFGIRNQLDLGYLFRAGALRGEPLVGIGHRWWIRDLEDSRSATGEPVSGYSEIWQTAYARLGARAAYRAERLDLFAEGGALYPFYTGNSVDFVGTGDVTFHPRGRVSGFAEAGVAWNGAKLSLHYEGFRWSRSGAKAVGDRFFFQPNSRSDLVGVSLGWNFR